MGLKYMYKLGLKKSCLIPVKGKMSAINGEGINILGAVFLRLEGTDESTGQAVQTAVMVQLSLLSTSRGGPASHYLYH